MNTRTILASTLTLLCLLSGRSLAQAEKPAEGEAASGKMMVVAVSGAVKVESGGDMTGDLKKDTTILPDAVVTTGDDGHAAIGFGAGVESGRNLVLIGPESKVEFHSAAAEEGGVAVELHGGRLRVLVRTGESTMVPNVTTGDRVVQMTGADAIVIYGGGADKMADDATYALRRGHMTIKAGKRTLRVLPRMERTVEDGHILGAARFAGEEWDEMAAAMNIEGLDLSDAPRPRAPRTRAEAAPKIDEGAAPSASGEDDFVYARMTTSMGDIVLQLDRGRAPVSVENFVAYANDGFYEGTIFHRVMSNFMIQGGGFDEAWEKRTTMDPIHNEWQNGLKNVRGTIAMARLGGQPDSATSQFFINVKDNASLDRPQPDGAAYAVFGRVVDGMDVVDAIRAITVVPNPAMRGERSKPQEPPVIQKVEIIDESEALAD